MLRARRFRAALRVLCPCAWRARACASACWRASAPRPNDAIDEFLSLALAYEALNTPSLEGFLHWLEHGDAEIKRDMERGRDEVRVMTVHGAKGLEADIVILPDTTALPERPGQRGDLLYTDDGVLFPVPTRGARSRAARPKRGRQTRR